MTHDQDKWMSAALAPARRLDPAEPDVLAVLIRFDAKRQSRSSFLPSYAHRTRRADVRPWRRRGVRFNIVLAIIGALLLMTAIAVASGLVSPSSIVPGGSSDSRDDSQFQHWRTWDRKSPFNRVAERKRDGHIRSHGGKGVDIRLDPRSLESEELVVAGEIDSVFDGIDQAVKEGLAPLTLYMNPQIALEQVKDVEGLQRWCEMSSEKTIKQTIDYAAGLALFEDFEWTCERAMAVMLRNAKVNHGLDTTLASRIVGINLVGDAGTVTIDRGRNQALATVPLVKEDGEWKLGESPGIGKIEEAIDH